MAIPRAYLAHSSTDKAYVEEVVSFLDRAHVVYDRVSFQPGEDFRALIRKGLADSSLLVLFASINSLTSDWVRFELSEGEMRVIGDPTYRVLVIGIERGIGAQQLPRWMRRSLALLGAPAAPNAARMIQQRLAEQVASDYQPPFVGRETEIEEFVREMFPRPGERPPQALIVTGLPGIGRRTFARRIQQDYLSLMPGPVLVVREQDNLESLYLRIVDDLGQIQTRTELSEWSDRFRRLSSGQKAEEFARVLHLLSVDNVSATFVDDYHVLLNEAGQYRDEITQVLRILRSDKPNVFITLVHRRRPLLRGPLSGQSPVAVHHPLKPLSLESTKLLLSQSFRLCGLEADATQTDRLAQSVLGYPPLASLIAKLSKLYGIDAVLSDRALLDDFKIRTFVPLLSRLKLTDPHWKALRFLAAESALSLEVLATATGSGLESMALVVRELVDFNLVHPSGNLYEISGPLREAVQRLRGGLSEQEYRDLALRLKEKYWHDDNQIPPLLIVDATIHAIGRSKSRELEEFRDILLPSQLHRIAAEAYHDGDWQTAEEFAQRAIEAQEDLDNARELLLKALVKQGRWADAESVLAEFERRGSRRQFYLRGFLEWKRRNLLGAIQAFRAALSVGDKSISVRRDLAHCLFRQGGASNLDQARSLIRDRMEQPNPNRYVVDLAAQIAIARGAWQEARELLEILEIVDSEDSFLHRRAMYHAASGKLDDALADARRACDGRRPATRCSLNWPTCLLSRGTIEPRWMRSTSCPRKSTGSGTYRLDCAASCS